MLAGLLAAAVALNAGGCRVEFSHGTRTEGTSSFTKEEIERKAERFYTYGNELTVLAPKGWYDAGYEDTDEYSVLNLYSADDSMYLAVYIDYKEDYPEFELEGYAAHMLDYWKEGCVIDETESMWLNGGRARMDGMSGTVNGTKMHYRVYTVEYANAFAQYFFGLTYEQKDAADQTMDIIAESVSAAPRDDDGVDM